MANSLSLPSPPSRAPVESDRAVRDRYSAAARVWEAALCCPVDYPAHYLIVWA